MKFKHVAFPVATLLFISLFLADISRAENSAPLKVGAHSTSTRAKEMIEKYQPVMDYLSKRLGRPVEIRVFATNAEILGKLGSGDLDAAILGGSGGARAVRDLGAIPVARPEKGGVSGYRGCIIVREDSGIRKIEDLKGKRFDYVEKGITAGYVYPRSVLVGKKLDPDRFFGSTAFAGKHDIAIMKVLNGESDGASVKDLDLEKVSVSDARVKRRIIVLQKSVVYPDGTILFRKGTDAATVKAAEKALIGIEKDPKGKSVLAAAGADRYIPTSRKDYAETIHAMNLARE